MRQLYLAVIVPRMLYAADIFCANKLSSVSPHTGFLGEMARVQRALMLQITGALRSTPTDILNIETDLPPFKLLVKKVCHHAFMRLSSLPPRHPLSAYINSSVNCNILKHRSPLLHLRNAFDIDPKRVEKIDHLPRDPQLQPQIPVHIDKSKEDALWTYLLRPAPPTTIFTDGSGYGDVIGAAAILRRRNAQDSTLQFSLGPNTEHTVYKGELVGIALALHHIARAPSA